MKYLMLFLLVLLSGLLSNNSYAQGYRGIVPMRSNCEDVKRILQIEVCKSRYESHNLKNESIEISFSTEKCPKAYLKRWNVEIGTVISIIVYPRPGADLKKFTPGISACKSFRGSNMDEIIYNCENDGARYSVTQTSTYSFVNHITFTPTLKDTKKLSHSGKCKK